MKKVILGLGLVGFARAAMKKTQRRLVLRKRRRGFGLLGFAVAAAGTYLVVRAWQDAQSEETPAWPSKKKLAHDARVAAARARDQAPAKPAVVHVQRDASPDLKVPLGDLTK